ncbi:hypothetical protein M885DRAFT_476168 [Pelagophyceae sp. CCMP2097]|nr:hypothetical protein M885DRAFT_476168 [Pelagophyceae sp. CCMP2097]|mmetsp:Transcript_29079/g.102742  ORF Transcript_29079/g.102742 Transcript_29079/m.102742 type:complete len:214 (-) Transcript_29079:27-668(-)
MVLRGTQRKKKRLAKMKRVEEPHDSAAKEDAGPVEGAVDETDEGAARRQLQEERRRRKKAKRSGVDAAPAAEAPAPAAAVARVPEPYEVGVERTVSGGVVVTDLELGSGAAARHASAVDVAYEAFYSSENHAERKLDTATKKDPYSFVVGTDTVIKGLSFGVKGMRPGGRRAVFVPHHLGYGVKGDPPKVPPRATLRFVVEMLDVGVGFIPGS